MWQSYIDFITSVPTHIHAQTHANTHIDRYGMYSIRIFWQWYVIYKCLNVYDEGDNQSCHS